VVADAASAPLNRASGARQPAQILLAAVLFALFVRTFALVAAIVPTDSMSPTLLAGDRVLVNRMIFAPGLPPALARWLPAREPRPGDVVWLRSPLDRRTSLVKRVAALGGDVFDEQRVPPQELAVLGDHRAASLDSRRFGPVTRAAVGGQVVLVLWSSSPDAGRARWLRAVR